MITTANPSAPRPRARRLRRIGAVLLAVLLAGAAFAAIGLAGVGRSMSGSFAAPPRSSAALALPAAAPLPSGRITVAVVIGASGTVATDALDPYEVFARSDRFATYTVAAARTPLPLSGGLHLLPDHTFDEALPRPDVVVVPAVDDPTGEALAALRRWVGANAARGSLVLGVCVGAKVLAAAGLLDGHRATSFWPAVDSLQEDYPAVDWVRGVRYVQDGPITTTAGVSSGTVGALRLVEQLAGAPEAARVGAAVAYPGWAPGATTAIPVQRWTPADLALPLNAAFPWLQPTVAIGLVDGVGEIDAAAAMEVYAGASMADRTVPVGAGPVVRTRHGLTLVVEPVGPGASHADRLVVPGVTAARRIDPAITRWAADRGLDVERPTGTTPEFGFDPLLRDLARHGDRASALVAAKYSEYPSAHLDLAGPAWPWLSTALLGAALALAVGIGLLPTAVRRAAARRRVTSRVPA